MNIQQLMKQAQKMQEQLQRELEETVVEASVGGGVVEVKMTGQKQLLGLTIDPEVIDPEDPEMLGDLIVAATNQALTAANEAAQAGMGGIAGGLDLGGLLG